MGTQGEVEDTFPQPLWNFRPEVHEERAATVGLSFFPFNLSAKIVQVFRKKGIFAMKLPM